MNLLDYQKKVPKKNIRPFSRNHRPNFCKIVACCSGRHLGYLLSPFLKWAHSTRLFENQGLFRAERRQVNFSKQSAKTIKIFLKNANIHELLL
jgi:hypothetical protein